MTNYLWGGGQAIARPARPPGDMSWDVRARALFPSSPPAGRENVLADKIQNIPAIFILLLLLLSKGGTWKGKLCPREGLANSANDQSESGNLGTPSGSAWSAHGKEQFSLLALVKIHLRRVLPIVAFIKDEWVNSLLIQILRKEGILQEKAALSRAYCRFIKCCSVEACRKPVLTSRLHKLYLSSQWSVCVWCFSRPVCSLSSPLPQLWAILTFLTKVCQICKRDLQPSVFPARFIPKPGFPGFELMRNYGDRANKHQGLNLCAQVFDVSCASSNESFTPVS